MKLMPIGKLSKLAGVKVTTIRYYESIGLIREPLRSDSGRRLYAEEAVQELSFIRHSRDLGFSIDSIEGLLDLQSRPDQDCSDVERIARGQLGEVQKRLIQLQALEAELKRMIKGCNGGVVGTCKIMAALNDHEECQSDEHERVLSL